MPVVRKSVHGEKALVRRYLVWCFKTTKESLDRIDRKFTQVSVDRYILTRIHKTTPSKLPNVEYQKLVENFKSYIDGKEKDGLKQKFFDVKKKRLNPQYVYLVNRLIAIEHAIKHFLGARELTSIHLMYEQEMTRRILESREH